MNFTTTGQNRFHRSTVAKEGDFVICNAGRTEFHSLTLEKGKIFNNRLGHFHHDDIIGAKFGSWIQSRLENTDKKQPKKKGKGGKGKGKGKGSKSSRQIYGHMVLLRPTAELWTKALSHRTQIIYHADISLILLGLKMKPGFAGTSFSTFPLFFHFFATKK